MIRAAVRNGPSLHLTPSAARSAMRRAMFFDQLLQGDRVVVRFVARSIEQRRRLPMSAFAQRLQSGGGRLLLELFGVSCDEFSPCRGIAMQAAPQFIARGDVLEPKIDTRLILGESARPQTIDQNAKSVGAAGRLVYAFDPYTKR